MSLFIVINGNLIYNDYGDRMYYLKIDKDLIEKTRNINNEYILIENRKDIEKILSFKSKTIFIGSKDESLINDCENLFSFLNHFKKTVEYYPTVIIGDKYIVGFNDTMEKEYIDSIYYSYRNEIETIIFDAFKGYRQVLMNKELNNKYKK